jgi:hypothetical protein
MKNLTDITLLLDRTGSMQNIASDVVGGYNIFIQKQKEAPGEAVFTLVQFDSENPQEVIHDAKLMQDVPAMGREDFVPRAMTPLLDAMGRAIVRTGERLGAMSDGDRPDKVVFVVFTDGMENTSLEYTQEQVSQMVKTQTEDYNWQFVFLGADMDAFGQAQVMGVNWNTTLDLGKQNTTAAFAATSDNLEAYRSSGDSRYLLYSDKQRSDTSKK